MQIIDNIIILALPVIAFIVGKRISDKYHESTIDYLVYQLRLTSAEKGVGYVAPPPLKKNRSPIGEEFMERMRANGRATTRINQ